MFNQEIESLGVVIGTLKVIGIEDARFRPATESCVELLELVQQKLSRNADSLYNLKSLVEDYTSSYDT
jgi:hypothetical protein